MALLLYLYGSTPRHFDYIYIGALCVSAIFCWQDKDSFGALVVLLCYWLLSKIIYIAPDTVFYRIVIYSCSLGIAIFYFRYPIAKVLTAFVVFTVCIEFYWWMSAYANKPRIIYFIGLMAIAVWLKRLLINRALLMSEYLGYSGGKVALDGNVGAILFGYFILLILMTTEYFIRHLTSFKDMLIIYDLFPPISMFMSALTLAVIYMHYFYNQSQKHLSA
jgi:hypothetical protein